MPAKQPKLLLVDDHEANLVALRDVVVSRRGGSPPQAGSGREAPEMLLDHDVAWPSSTCICRSWMDLNWPS